MKRLTMIRLIRFKVWILVCMLALAMNSAVSAQPLPRNMLPDRPAETLSPASSTFFLDTAGNITETSMVLDSAGGIHIAASPLSMSQGSTFPAYYAYCASSCTQPANWTILSLENLGISGGGVRLALDPAGHPRMMWDRDLTNDYAEFRYAACDSQCTQLAHWTIISVATSYSTYLSDLNRYFALDPQGRPRFVYQDNHSATSHVGTFYRYCDSACTNPANWLETALTPELLSRPSLAFTASGQPRFAFEYFTSGAYTLGYFECNTTCGSAANWANILVYDLGGASTFTLRLDRTDRPRLAYYTGRLGTAYDNLLFYVWCDAGCTTINGWDNSGVGLPAQYGVAADLSFDNQNHPHLAYYIDVSPYALGYSHCTANCESSQPTWQSELIETADELNLLQPVPKEPGCTLSSWYPGQKPALALNASGAPYFSYTAEHLQGGVCQSHTDIQLARVALGGDGGSQLFVYLPIIKR